MMHAIAKTLVSLALCTLSTWSTQASQPPMKNSSDYKGHARHISMEIKISHDSMKEFVRKFHHSPIDEKPADVVIEIPTERNEYPQPIHVNLILPPNIAQRITGAGIFLIATHSCLEEGPSLENSTRCITGCANMAPEMTSSLFKYLLAKCFCCSKIKRQ
ncbi:MAG: hypothetical protein NTX86_03535 [Candidatus Dependentiae bacterium]|nr:hypothetical protein [Candidatus Dependentiae bacterium]